MVVFDDRTYFGMGNNAMLHSADFTTTGPHYSFDIASAASEITITFTRARKLILLSPAYEKCYNSTN